MASVRYLVDDVDAVDCPATRLDCALPDHCSPPHAVAPGGALAPWLGDPGPSAARPMPDGAVLAPGGWPRIVVEIENFDARVSALKAVGVRFRNEPLPGPDGTRVPIANPAGHPIELFAPRA